MPIAARDSVAVAPSKIAVKPKPVNKPPSKPVELKRSVLEVFDIPIDLLVDSKENPNEQDEATFDQLTQGVEEEGVDEPIIVVPGMGELEGKFLIVSGHHRKKAALVKGKTVVPGVIKQDWDDSKRLIEIVRRNQLKGQLNAEKFVGLFNELAKRGIDKSVLQLQMGFTQKQTFDKLFKQVEKNLTPTQKKKLAEAKERVTSVDSFSTVLNEIFTEHGSELDHGLIVFKYGDKNKKTIHYVETDAELDKRMKSLQDEITKRGLHAADVFNYLLKNVDLSKVAKSEKVVARKELRKPK